MSLATLTKVGRAAIAKAIMERRLHLAWGTGLVEWDGMAEADLPSLVEKTALENEIGRRLINIKDFCEPNEEGDIAIPVGMNPDGTVEEDRYQRCENPEPYLFLQASYNFGDAPSAVIREMGIFMDTVANEDVPPGKLYLEPGEVADAGLLLAAQIVKPPINRSPSVRQQIQFVLPI